jgi:hypothetical protein
LYKCLDHVSPEMVKEKDNIIESLKQIVDKNQQTNTRELSRVFIIYSKFKLQVEETIKRKEIEYKASIENLMGENSILKKRLQVNIFKNYVLILGYCKNKRNFSE